MKTNPFEIALVVVIFAIALTLATIFAIPIALHAWINKDQQNARTKIMLTMILIVIISILFKI